MKVKINNVRRDGKYTVSLIFDHGVTLRKIYTRAQLDEAERRAAVQAQEKEMFEMQRGFFEDQGMFATAGAYK